MNLTVQMIMKGHKCIITGVSDFINVNLYAEMSNLNKHGTNSKLKMDLH